MACIHDKAKAGYKLIKGTASVNGKTGENKERQNSFYSTLYEKIPENHILKQIEKAVDFSFINELPESSYCKNFGRPAKEPEMMMKLLFLQCKCQAKM